MPTAISQRHSTRLVAGALLAGILLFPHRARAEDDYAVRLDRTLALSDSLQKAGENEPAIEVLRPLIDEARARDDSGALGRLLFRKGERSVLLGHLGEAEESLREALLHAKAARDSASYRMSLRWLGLTMWADHRPDEAVRIYRELLPLARAAGDKEREAGALAGLALASMHRDGDYEAARRGFEEAVALYREADERYGEGWVLNHLGSACLGLRDLEGARRCYQRAADVARSIGDFMGESTALARLGGLEYSFGDPAESLLDFRKAYDILREHDAFRWCIAEGCNTALCLSDLGRFREADELLAELRNGCREHGLVDQEYRVLLNIANLRTEEGRLGKAAAMYREFLAAGAPLVDAADLEANARVGLARILIDRGEPEEALTVLAGLGRDRQRLLRFDVALVYEIEVGKCLLRAGRAGEALARLRAVETEAAALGSDEDRMAALAAAADCERVLGHPDSSLVLLRRASDLWNRERGVSLDPEWREQRGALGQAVFMGLADLMLRGDDEGSVGRTFDMLQRFKARTLLERLFGPARYGEEGPATPPPLPVTLDRLRNTVLREGEVFLDVYEGAEFSLLFAVTRDTCRVVRLPGTRDGLEDRLGIYHQIVAAPPTADDGGLAAIALEQSGDAMSALLLGHIADGIRPCRRIILAPDGAWNLVPLNALSLPGEGPLLASRELLRVPSATLLAEIRSRPAGPGGEDERPRVLAAAGVNLEGAVREVRGMGRHYTEVDVRVGADPPIATSELGRYDVLHLAAHTWIDDQNPWRSGILLGEEQAGGGDGLRAAEIATLRFPARLAVLSGCESGSGRVLSGEGILGLSSAFLGAGVPAVVVTLWPVEDRATERLMTRFYDSLHSGETAAAALRSAQLALRNDPRTSAPFFWAGFVLVGDGDVRVHLERKAPSTLLSVATVLLLALGAALVWRRTR